MSDKTIIFFLAVASCLLFLVVLYQRFVFGRGIQALMELEEQINRLLIDRQKIRADFKREEISCKKMLANISHDIKTPLTVILGYLEIMRLNHADHEMLKIVETKANQVMNLINQFFTLAKLESGDTNINLGKVNINEICRENVLEFYDILLQKDFDVDLFIPETAIFVQGEKEALQRILYNLLSNVIRYGFVWKSIGKNLLRGAEAHGKHH